MTNTTNTELTVAQLREILKGLGLDTKGKKAELIERWDAHVQEQLKADEPKPLPKMHALREARKHYVTTTVGTKASVNCGDDLAQLLAPLDHKQVAELAGYFADEDLLARYAHLNNGQIRMNSGNRLRGMLKAGKVSMDDVLEQFSNRWGAKAA